MMSFCGYFLSYVLVLLLLNPFGRHSFLEAFVASPPLASPPRGPRGLFSADNLKWRWTLVATSGNLRMGLRPGPARRQVPDHLPPTIVSGSCKFFWQEHTHLLSFSANKDDVSSLRRIKFYLLYLKQPLWVPATVEFGAALTPEAHGGKQV